MKRLGQSRVRHHQSTVIQDQVIWQVLDESHRILAEPRRLPSDLFQRLRQAMLDLDRPTQQRPPELVVMVADDAQRGARRHAGHRQSQYSDGIRAPVYEVAQEHEATPFLVAEDVVFDGVCELPQEFPKLRQTAVDVSHDVVPLLRCLHCLSVRVGGQDRIAGIRRKDVFAIADDSLDSDFQGGGVRSSRSV